MKKVLVAPLDWGLGHATRCVPLVRQLLRRGCEVYIAGSGDSLALLTMEFPMLTFFDLPAYAPVYSRGSSMAWRMAAQLPKFIRVINKEHRRTESLVLEHKIDLLISDNRYGCWSASVASVFITHQYNILLPKYLSLASSLINRINHNMIGKFSTCWIPDIGNAESLAGKLGAPGASPPVRTEFIGNLSRFKEPHERPLKYDVVCIFSGPEPQRSALEKIVVGQVKRSGLSYFVVRGLPKSSPSQSDNTADFLDGEALQVLIEQSTMVIARSGFSTIMDLARLQKRAIFIPTPGQTEQEYLARRLMKMKIAYFMEQHAFNFDKAWLASEAYTGFCSRRQQSNLLERALDQILPTLPGDNVDSEDLQKPLVNEKFS